MGLVTFEYKSKVWEIYDGKANLGVFTKRLLSLMKLVIRMSG